jgi:hypothetical protein
MLIYGYQVALQAKSFMTVKYRGGLSETTLNYRMIVERYPNLKEKVGNSNPGCELSSLPDEKLASWSTASCDWAGANQPAHWFPSLEGKGLDIQQGTSVCVGLPQIQ